MEHLGEELLALARQPQFHLEGVHLEDGRHESWILTMSMSCRKQTASTFPPQRLDVSITFYVYLEN